MTSHTRRRRITNAFRRLLGKAGRVRRQIRRGREEMQADIKRRLHNFFYNPLPSSEEEEIPPPLPPRNPVIPPPLPPRNPVILADDDDDDIDEIPPPLPPRNPRVRPLPPVPVSDRPLLPPLPSPTPRNNVYLSDILRPALSQRRAAIEASDDEDGEYSGFGRVKLNKRRRRRRNPLAGTPAMKAHMAWVRSFKRS